MIRNTKNFNPKEHLAQSFKGYDPQGNPVYTDYLETMWRVQWFLEYCEEYSIEGVIDDSKLCLIGNAPFLYWMATADVYMDNKKVGSSAAAVPAIGQDGVVDNYAAQTACTHAKGRALANAGFSAATTIAYEDGKNEFADAPVEVVQQPAPQTSSSFSQPMNVNQPATNQYVPAPEIQRIPKNEPMQNAGYQPVFSAVEPLQQTMNDMNNSNYEVPEDSIFGQPMGSLCEEPDNNAELKPTSSLTDIMTPEIARAVVIPNGKYAQQKMGDVYLSDPGYIKWIVNKGVFKDKRPDLDKAATILNDL